MDQGENDNIRPPTDIYQDQMIGGPSNSYSQRTINFPGGGFTHIAQASYFNSGRGETLYPFPQNQMYNDDEYQEDSYMQETDNHNISEEE